MSYDSRDNRQTDHQNIQTRISETTNQSQAYKHVNVHDHIVQMIIADNSNLEAAKRENDLLLGSSISLQSDEDDYL